MGDDGSTGGCEKTEADTPPPSPPVSLGCRWLLVCGFLLAQEWRLAAWPLGTAGQCSQSPVCSPACAAPWVSPAPGGEANKKEPLSHHTGAALQTHSSSLLHGGSFLFSGEGRQKKGFSRQQGLKITKVLFYAMSFLFSLALNANFELLLVVVCFPLFVVYSAPFV